MLDTESNSAQVISASAKNRATEVLLARSMYPLPQILKRVQDDRKEFEV